MLLKSLNFLLLASLLVSTSYAATTVENQKLTLKTVASAKQIYLKVVQLTPSKWTVAAITKELNKVNLIFAQCGVQIRDVDYYKMNYSPLITDIHPDQFSNYLEKSKIRNKHEAILVFAKRLDGDLASFFTGAGGFSINELMDESEHHNRENMIYILEEVLSPEYKKLRNAKYSPVAHELGHVFLNVGHETIPNLMAGQPVGLANDELTTSQCETLQRSPLLQ